MRSVTVVEKECESTECTCEGNIDKTTSNEHPTVFDTPETHFLKDFGKYPKNRIDYYMIINRI